MRWHSIFVVGFAATAAARPLTVSSPDWPPFYIQDSEKPLEHGFAGDILDICAAKIDPNADFHAYPIRRMMKYMERGELDINIMSFKPDRALFMDYGKEMVFENSYVVWKRRSLSNSISSIHYLDSLRIAQLVGIRPSDEFREWFDLRLKSKSEIDTLVLNNTDQIVKMLAHDRSDVTVSSLAEMKWRSNKLGLSKYVVNTGLVIKKQDYFLVIAKASPLYKRDPQILNKFDSCVTRLKSTGRWAQLQKYYGL